MAGKLKFIAIIRQREQEILKDWIKEQLRVAGQRKDLMSEAELNNQSKEFLKLFSRAISKGDATDIIGPEWAETRDFLGSICG